MSQDQEKQFSVRLPVELVDRLDDYAARTERSRAGVLRFALERFLAHDRAERAAATRQAEADRRFAAAAKKVAARRG